MNACSITWMNDNSADPVTTLSAGIALIYHESVDVLFGPATSTCKSAV